MADHVRKQIRAAAALLLTGLTTTGARVFPSRTHPLQEDEVPGKRIYTNDEEVDALDVDAGASAQDRKLELVIENCSKKLDSFDDEIDAMIKETEVAMAANPTLGGLAQFFHLKEIRVDMDGESERNIGVARMVYEVTYWANVSTPDAAL